MKSVSCKKQAGIALIIVMICITVLGLLAAGLAIAMKTETKLAMNSNSETELTWLGISGVELARYVVAQQLNIPQEPYDSLNQKWAGGPGGWNSSNSVLTSISLSDYPLGNGKFTVKITDMERKANINMADQRLLEQAFRLVGVDGSDFTALANSIIDWVDADDNAHMSGTESDHYQSLDPPYFARNRPMDDLSDLLLIKGITPDIFWGGVATNHMSAAFQAKQRMFGNNPGVITYPVGLVDLFTPVSSGRININTATPTVLQMLPFVDEAIAAEIIRVRSGPDGSDGTEDDTPFRNVGELINVPGINPQTIPQLQGLCDVRSRTFEVVVEAEINNYRRQFKALLGRNSTRDVQVLSFSWK